MANQGLLCVLGAVFFILSQLITHNALANPKLDLEAICSSSLETNSEMAGILNEVDADHQVQRESHELMEFFNPDYSINEEFSLKYLSNFMSASQYLLYLIYSQGYEEVPDKKTGQGKVKVYNFFHKGGPLTNYRRMIGHEREIETLVNQIAASARGDRFGNYPVMFISVPGTGKTEILDIIRTAYRNATLKQQKYFTYTFRMKNLGEVPTTAQFSEKAGGPKYRPAPMNHSPVTLFPEAVKKKLFESVEKKMKQTIGVAPLGQQNPDPQTKDIIKRLFDYYAEQKQKKGKNNELTVKEMLAILNHHFEIRRLILGDEGTAPLIPRQQEDADFEGLFVKPNLGEALASGDQSDPHSWMLSGTVLKGNRSVDLWDEFFKNPKHLQDKTLTFIQSKIFQDGGSPTIEVDTVNIIASNTEDVKLLNERDPNSPLLQRLKLASLRWDVRPQAIAKIIALETDSLMMKRLGDEESEWVPVRKNIDEFIPEVPAGKAAITSDRRYDLALGENSIDGGMKRIHISPHALMFMSTVAAITRMNLDPQLVEKVQKQEIVGHQIFRDPLKRVRIIMGLDNEIEPARLVELWNASEAANEGTWGIPQRSLTKTWLSEAINEAAKSNNGYCITPALLLKVLRNIVRNPDDTEFGATPEKKILTLKIAQAVMSVFTLSEMKNDINMATSGADVEAINAEYEDLIDQILALHQDAKATKYKSSVSGREEIINQAKVDDVAAIYKRLVGQDLSTAEISNFLVAQARVIKAEQALYPGKTIKSEPYQNLWNAVSRYLSRDMLKTQGATLRKLLGIASGSVRGSAEESEHAGRLMSTLRHKIGYCPHCAGELINIANIAEAQERNAEKKEAEGGQ